MVDSLAVARRSTQALQWRSLIVFCAALAAAAHIGSTAVSRRGSDAVIATTELTHGTVITSADISRARVLLPDKGARVLINDPGSIIGRRVIGHLAAGEPITTTRIQQHPSPTDLTAMAVPVSVADAQLVTIGDRVDIYSRQSSLQAGAARRIAREVEVVNVVLDTSRLAQSSATVIVLVDSNSAAAIAAAADQIRLSIAVHGIGASQP